MTLRPRIVGALVVVSVGLAFADASVVALALPDVYAEFDTSIVGVSWLLTTYALSVALTAVPVALLHRRLRPLTLVTGGVAIFALACTVAGLANSLPLLLAARAVQGVGATLLLGGSLAVLAIVVPQPGRARRRWALAGAVGVALGPALGGVLTEAFDWRAIFFVQAPIVAAVLAVAVEPDVRAQRREIRVAGDGEARPREVTVANIGFALVFAALVAALFLGVLLAVEVWRYSPLHSALLVSALPLGMIIGRMLQRAPAALRAGGGSALLALGLGVLAVVPGEQPVIAAVAFALCGAGFDLVHEVLDRVAVPETGPAVRASAVTIGARHAGLVLGLVLIAPVLSSSIDSGIDRATLGATRTMLEAELELSDKLPLIWDLRNAIEAAPRGQVPDLASEFDERGADDDNAFGRARDELSGTIIDALTRSFRPAFAIAAVLALLSAVPALAVATRATSRSAAGSRSAVRGIAGLGLIGVVVLGVAFVGGGANLGEFTADDPCTASADTYPGDGLDAAVQRIALSALNGAACELGTTREQLVLSLDESSGYDDVDWDDATLEEALRVGASRAIADADERDAIPGVVARILDFAARRAPIGWLVERIPLPGID